MSIIGAVNVKDYPDLIRLFRMDGEGAGKTDDLILNRLEAHKAVQVLQQLLGVDADAEGRTEVRSEAHDQRAKPALHIVDPTPLSDGDEDAPA